MNSNDYKQWISDVYHCSECWGQQMSGEEMQTMLIEASKAKTSDDYSPAPSMYLECAAYWNKLCEAYPN